MGVRRTDDAALLAANRKARHDYEVLSELEAGIELRGTEVKAVRGGEASLLGSYARVERGELWLYQLNIPAYEFGNRFNHEPKRARRLLVHRSEIRRLRAAVEQEGQTLVPLRLYLSRGNVKVALGICRGKNHGDRRETLKTRAAQRDAQRALRR